MNEIDDRLAGDMIWEMFPDRAAAPARESRRARWRWWLIAACAVAASWCISRPAAVLIACLAVAATDFRKGYQVGRTIPDKAGGTICRRFAYAWGAFKLGSAACALMFVSTFVVLTFALPREGNDPPTEFIAAVLLWVGGYALSAVLTFAGLVRAFRSGMRIWVGEGVNQARTLLLGMMIVGFAVLALGPMSFWLVTLLPHAGSGEAHASATVALIFGLMIGGPVVMLVIVDWLCSRVVADRPGKFGPKVTAVGKWNT